MKATYDIIIIFSLCLVSNLYSFSQDRLTPDQEIVAMTILGEARNQGEAGMYAVACVIQQRAAHWKRNGKRITPVQVCLQGYQFSCWNPNDPNRSKLRGLLNNNNKQAIYAKRLALGLGKLDASYVNNADHYCKVTKNPYWIKGEKCLKIVRQHKFYKLR